MKTRMRLFSYSGGRSGWLRLGSAGPGIAWKPASAGMLFSQRLGITPTYVVWGVRFWFIPAWRTR